MDVDLFVLKLPILVQNFVNVFYIGLVENILQEYYGKDRSLHGYLPNSHIRVSGFFSFHLKKGYQLSNAIRKPVYAICEQQRRSSACMSMQSDQRLCYSLPRYM